MDGHDQATLQVHKEASDLMQSTLELQIRFPEGQLQTIPLNRNSLDVMIASGTLHFSFSQGRVQFRSLDSKLDIYKDGQALATGHLEVGSHLDVSGHRVSLRDSGVPTAFLKGYSAPYSNEVWTLGAGTHHIGRPGRRTNAIQLDHPTVSREHATVVGDAEGKYHLLAESATNLVCLRGVTISPGQTEPLQNGDLLEVGDLVFRFHQPSEVALASQENHLIQVQSFSGLTVKVGGALLADKGWKTQYIKWLFAHLAYQWGRPIGTEILMDQLWPDAEPEKARNNFKYSLSTLRQILRSHLPEELQNTEIVLRSSSTLQLNPDLLDDHDAIDLQRFAQGPVRTEDPSWLKQAQKVILSYSGPFLPECYLDWAVSARQTLEIQLIDLARKVMTDLEAQENWESLIPIATHILQIDRDAQWVCLAAMKGLRATGRASEALKLFESSRKQWLRDLGVEPEVELLREHQRILSLL